MTATARLLVAWLLLAVCLTICAAPAQAIIVVYDLKLDFSNANNPNGVWAYYQGNTQLTRYTQVPAPEPVSGVLLALGGAALLVRGRRKGALGFTAAQTVVRQLAVR
jgi:hypothetical protein